MPTDDHTREPDPASPPPGTEEARASASPDGAPAPTVGDALAPSGPPWRTRGRRAWVRLRVLALPLALLTALAMVALAVYGQRVATRFEAREHETPTRLYGRAAPLTPGTLLPREEVVARLQRLGYRQTRDDPKVPGEFRASRALTVQLRPFETAAGTAAPRLLRIHWDGRRVSWVEDLALDHEVEDAVLPPELLGTLYGAVHEDRLVLPLVEFPPGLVDAVLVTEDRRFYKHHGIDPLGVARALVANASSGSIEQGGSTLTQQLAKNLYFDQRRTLARKAGEAIAAVLLEARYSKQRILQAYLNEVYLGQQGAVSIKGFARAASFYFGKDIRALDLGESATLAGLIRAPGIYNPFVHPDRAVERRNQVLAAMAKAGKITAEQLQVAQAKRLTVPGDRRTSSAPRAAAYLGDYVRQAISEDAGHRGAGDLSHAGLRVFTTIDPTIQRQAEESIARGLANLERSYRKLRRADAARRLQGAMVVLDPHDGSVLAMVGGRDYAVSQFNRATQAHRPPGSLFKPFVYLAGYELTVASDTDAHRFTPATQLQDEPLEMKVARKIWAPANYDGEFRGPVTAQMALEQSLNVPTVRAALQIGLKSVVATARDAGVLSPLKPYPSLALGAQEVTPLELANAYATIANGGVRHQAALVQSIIDARGRRTLSQLPQPERVVSAEAAYLVTVGLQGAMERGTAAVSHQLGFDGTAAGKTGTTDDYRDAWFCGYTPDLLALVWIGFDDGASVGLSGASAALPIWADFMQRVGAETDADFPEPRGIVWEDIDPVTGGRARWGCPDAQPMAFLEGTEPLEKCSEHGGFFSKWW